MINDIFYTYIVSQKWPLFKFVLVQHHLHLWLTTHTYNGTTRNVIALIFFSSVLWFLSSAILCIKARHDTTNKFFGASIVECVKIWIYVYMRWWRRRSEWWDENFLKISLEERWKEKERELVISKIVEFCVFLFLL